MESLRVFSLRVKDEFITSFSDIRAGMAAGYLAMAKLHYKMPFPT